MVSYGENWMYMYHSAFHPKSFCFRIALLQAPNSRAQVIENERRAPWKEDATRVVRQLIYKVVEVWSRSSEAARLTTSMMSAQALGNSLCRRTSQEAMASVVIEVSISIPDQRCLFIMTELHQHSLGCKLCSPNRNHCGRKYVLGKPFVYRFQINWKPIPFFSESAPGT
jgi:hypothetical protein